MVKPRARPRTAPRADEAPNDHDTLPGLAGRLRRPVAACGAEHFAVFLIGEREPHRLTPAIDAAWPALSARTTALVETMGDRFIRRAMESTRPFWWSLHGDSPAATTLSACVWAERVVAPVSGGTCLALPLTADRDGAGLMVLCGEGMEFSMGSLTDLHAHCLSLFGPIARLKQSAPAAVPAMSRREIECLRLTANGHTSEEIAVQLGLSAHTATQYLANSSQKLDAANRIHAVAKALRLGLID